MSKFIYIFLILFCCIQSNTINALSNNDPRVLEAFRVTEKPIIDGKIDALYDKIPSRASRFTTFDPVPGEPSKYKTDVFIVYDDQAIFIAAKLYDNPEDIIRDLSPRDALNNTDFFGISFDPYRAGISGFSFVVSAAGVQFDAKEGENGDDSSWNDVWKSAVKIVDDGWIVEMEIPYSALRFPTGNINDWNFNLVRSVRKSREKSFWNPIDPNVDGFLPQMGVLKNIRDVKSPLRLSLTPYVGYQANTFTQPNGKAGFDNRLAGGLDVKYGINDAFTLDMILIPDFSQVRSDVQVLNLSPFEVRFDENRPFFTEGLELFETANIVYTRRIGARGYLLNDIRNQGDFQSLVSAPNNNLVNATKISGRTNSKTGLGFFNAVEVPTYGEYIDTSGNKQRQLINPLTNYNVFVVEQALKNNSSIGLINTNVYRKGNALDANVTGLDWNLRNKSQKYDFQGTYVLSRRFQEDAETDKGYKLQMDAGKISGVWTYEAGLSLESANYNINDLGFLFSPNEQVYYAGINYNKYNPKNGNIANYRINNEISYEKLFSPNLPVGIFTSNQFTLRLKSFNAFGIWIRTAPIGFKDYFEPRLADFSKYVLSRKSALIGGFISSDYRKPLAIDIRTNYRKYDFEDRYSFDIDVSPRIRLSSQVFIIPSVNYQRQQVNRGFVFHHESDGLNPDDILIGIRDVNTFNNSILGQFNINNKASITLQANHFFSSVDYTDYKILLDDGELVDTDYSDLTDDGEKKNDRNFNFFTINAVYTWRFAPGSDLIISYKSDLGRNTDERRYIQNLSRLNDFYRQSGINIKALYFLDVNRFIQRNKKS